MTEYTMFTYEVVLRVEYAELNNPDMPSLNVNTLAEGIAVRAQGLMGNIKVTPVSARLTQGASTPPDSGSAADPAEGRQFMDCRECHTLGYHTNKAGCIMAPPPSVKMKWRRIEPGFYELVGTDWKVANMKGQSVLYSGLIVDPWHVRDGNETVARFHTKAEAQAYAVKQVS
jgi:hypothetical protein